MRTPPASICAALATLALLPRAHAAEPLTLEGALAEASRQGIDLRQAKLLEEGAEIDLYAAWSGYLPRVDLGASFGRTYFGPQTRVSTVPVIGADPATGGPTLRFEQQPVEIPGDGFANYTLGLQLRQPVFDGLRTPRLLERGRVAIDAARRQVNEAALATAFEVTRRYFEVVKAERSARVLEETLARSEEFVRRAEALFEAGRLQRNEVLSARVNLGNDRIGLASQRARVAQARADLAAMLGRPSGEPLELAPPATVDSPALGTAPLPDEATLLARARERRPLLLRYRDLARTAELDRKIASANRWPQVGATLAYDRSGPTFAGSEGVWGDPTRQYAASAQLGVQWNLYDGRQTRADEQRAEIQRRRVELEAEQAERQIALELARARAALEALAQTLELAEQNRRAAEDGVELARRRLEAGAATQLELRDASLKLTQAQLTLVNARIDWLVGRAELARAAGGGEGLAP